YVFDHNKNSTKTSTSTSASTGSASTPVSADNFVNVIQDDGSITQHNAVQIGKTTDEADIITALHDSCTGKNTYVTVNHAVFEGGKNFKQDGNFAEINATACTALAKSADDLAGSGSAN